MKLPILFAALLATAACAHNGNFARGNAPSAPSNRIADADFARIPKDKIGPVDKIRDEVRAAQDAALRADQQLGVAEKKIDVERSELAVRRSESELAKSQVDLAKATGDRAKIDGALRDQDRADATVQFSAAKAEVAGRERDRIAAQASLAHKEVKVAEAKLEVAKLDALKAAGDASADNYEHRNFEQALYLAQTDARRAEDDLKDDALLRQAHARLDQAKDALGRAGSEMHPVRGVDAPKSGD